MSGGAGQPLHSLWFPGWLKPQDPAQQALPIPPVASPARWPLGGVSCRRRCWLGQHNAQWVEEVSPGEGAPGSPKC